jgi:FixJ family two-component response regulator
VSDVIMPQMSGRELAGRLAPMRPEMHVLYMSGYPDNTIVQHGVLEPGTAFLQKPFTISALELKVREILDGARKGGRQIQTFEQISLFRK